MARITQRHIQNLSEAAQLEPHWGYVDRAVPCTNDAGSCAYLDVVYHSHDLGMLYMGIIWATIIGILLIWAVGRRCLSSQLSAVTVINIRGEDQLRPRNGTGRLTAAAASFTRRHLLPNSIVTIFGHTTRLQVLVLAILSGYLLIFNFVGIVYNTWVTPVKNMPGVSNTRTSLGPWADRIGVIAYALTPLSILLSSRESLLSLLTGLPYQSFMFLHRWLGYIIIIQSALHTIGWCVVEWRLYQPQPSVWNAFIAQIYIIWGVVAMVLLLLLYICTLPWTMRLLGYEFFRKAHYILAMVYIGAVIGHWPALQCFLVPGLVLWFVDRAARAVRTALLHYRYLPSGKMGFAAAQAHVAVFPDSDHGDIVRLDFRHPQEPWELGQHFYLTFAEGSIWQSHPFTPLNVPVVGANGTLEHSYVFRAKRGETKETADIALRKGALVNGKEAGSAPGVTTPVVMTGPYGQSIVRDLRPGSNVLCVAGGTGITFVLPVLLNLIKEKPQAGRKVELVWAIRREADMAWVSREMDELRAAGLSHHIKTHVFVTKELVLGLKSSPTHVDDEKSVAVKAQRTDTSSSDDDVEAGRLSVSHPERVDTPRGRRPHLDEIVGAFVTSVAHGPTTVFASGPLSMISNLRSSVATQNDGGKVWRGEERFDVKLVCDDRIEW